MGYYLSMDGVDDRIQIPAGMTFNRIEIDMIYESTSTSGQKRIWSLPLGESFLMVSEDKLGYHAGTHSNILVDGVLTENNALTANGIVGKRMNFTSNLNSTRNNIIYICNSDGNTAFTKGRLFSIKVFLDDNLLAHYDMSTGTVLNQAQDNYHATLVGGTWVEIVEPQPEPPQPQSYYLQMDGVDDYLKTPSMVYNKAILDIKVSDSQVGTANRKYGEFRPSFGNGWFNRQLNGNENFGSAISSIYCNGIRGNLNTNFVPDNERVTIEMNFSNLASTSAVVFANITSNGEFLEGDIHSVKFLLGDLLVAHYNMSKGTVLDQSGNGNHGTLVGGTWIEVVEETPEPELHYYLQTDAVDDYAIPPIMQFDEVVMTMKDAYEDFIKIEPSSFIWLDTYVNPPVIASTESHTWSVSINGGERQVITQEGNPPDEVTIDTSVKSTVSIKNVDSDVINNQIYFFTGNNGYFAGGKYYDIKILLNGVVQAHYDLTKGNFQDQSGNDRHATLHGGTWVIDPDVVDTVDTTPPKVTMISASRTKISDEPGMNQSIITISFDRDVTEYVARLNGVDHNTGEIVHEGGALLAGQEGEVIIDWDELTTEGDNRINIYGKNTSGIWTLYEA